MLSKKKKKVVKMRGSFTHGWGAKKKHRGKGNKGGAGMAGSGARADSKKPSVLKKYGKAYFGKKGFKSLDKIKSEPKNIINLSQIENFFDDWLKEGFIKKDGETYILNLNELGFDKLLGTGEVYHTFKINVAEASEKAKDKVTKLSGEILLLEAKEE